MSDPERQVDAGASGESTGPGETGGAEQQRSPWRTRALSGLQWVVALGAFWYVARDVDWAATLADLASVPPAVVVAIIGITAVEFVARFSKWYVLLNARVETPFLTTARFDLVIKFVNHVVPSKASGHSLAPLVIRHYTDADWTESVSIAGLNTGLYASLYGLTALLGLVLFAAQLGSGLLVVILLSTGIYLVAGTLILLAGRRMEVAGALVGRLESLLARLPYVGERLAGIAGAVPSFTADSADVFRDVSARPGVLAGYALGWAGTLVVAPGLRVWLLLTALGGTFSPAFLLPVVLVMAYSVTVLPLTPGGVGVAEASATAVLVALGVDPALATVVILVDRTFGVYLPAMIGWVPMARLDLADVLSREA